MTHSRGVELPSNFDTTAWLLGRWQDGRLYHPIPYSARFAANLLNDGRDEALAIAERVIERVLDGQETDPADPHFGNFRFQLEEETVEDLNIVQFVMSHLIPSVIKHAHRLSPMLIERAKRSTRLSLHEIARLDVSETYSNVAVECCTNLCLGGQLLDDGELVQLGRRKLDRIFQITDSAGYLYEFNSPSYINKCVEALAKLSSLSTDRQIAVRAKVLLSRIALSAALHVHPSTGRLAGPHGRAYFPTVVGSKAEGAGAVAPEIGMLRRWLGSGVLPAWIEPAIGAIESGSMSETSSVADDLGITTFFAPAWALGVATRNLSSQANRFIAWQSSAFTFHFQRRDSVQPGSVFARYTLDDKWYGDFEVSPVRKNEGAIVSQPVFPDEGSFCGVQERERAIGLYAPESLGALEPHGSAKGMLVWPRWGAPSDEVWVGEERVRSFPVTVPRGATVVVASGDAMLAVRPLELTDLGGGAPVRFVIRDDFLVLELCNYVGPQKTFWELAWPGAFYQGRPRCGFYVEAADRTEYPSSVEFARDVAAGVLVDEAAPAFTYRGEGRRPWRVQYARDGRTLGVEVDLMEWKRPARRWTHEGELGWAMLESSVARETRDGLVRVGDAEVRCGKAAAWLLALPERELYVAAYHGPEPAPFSMKSPYGKVDIESMGPGLVIWDQGHVTVDALDLTGKPKITGDAVG